MREHEAIAQDLASKLRAEGIDATAVGAGVLWRVEVRSGSERALVVHCFWHERHGLVHALNSANARAPAPSRPPPYGGPEYLVCLRDRTAVVAEGRTRSAHIALACARAWLGGADLDELVTAHPFIGENQRAMRAIAATLEPKLRWEIGPDRLDTLWAYEEGRSCALALENGSVACRFLLLQAEIACVVGLDDVAGAIRAWLVERVGIAELARIVPDVELEPHVETIETAPATWHWALVRDYYIRNPESELAPLRSLLEALAARPLPTRFYSFKSHATFCFSASSHFPWVDEGLPRISAHATGSFVIDDQVFDLAGAVAKVESVLASYPVQPFFGSAPHHEYAFLAESLRRRGSALRPFLFQRGAWFSLRVADGARRCDVSGAYVEFAQGSQLDRRTFTSLDDATRAICDFIERAVPFDRLGGERLGYGWRPRCE